MWIRRRRDAAKAAALVLDIFYDAFGYRGLTSLDGRVASGTHGETQVVFGAFPPEDLCKTARRLGWTPRLHAPGEERDEEGDEEGDEETVVIDLQRGAAAAQLVLSGRVPDTRSYQSAFLDLGDPLPREEAKLRVALQGTPAFEHAPMRVGRTLHFAGGVTADWLLTQLASALALAHSVTALSPHQVH